MAHTSGVWIAKPRAVGGYLIEAHDEVLAPLLVATVHVGMSLEEARDNARLVALSPVLYDYVARLASEGDEHAARIISSV